MHSRPRHPQLQSWTSVRPEHRRQSSHKQNRAPSKWRTAHRVLPRAHQHRAHSVPYSVSPWLHLPDSGHISRAEFVVQRYLCCPVYVRLPSLASEFQLQGCIRLGIRLRVQLHFHSGTKLSSIPRGLGVCLYLRGRGWSAWSTTYTMLLNSTGEVGPLPRPDDEDWCELLIAV